MKRKFSPLSWLFMAIIRGYQTLLSPLLGPRCRYHPSCSNYALDALRKHGVLRGGWLALLRIGRCHPWGGHGCDPVPETLPRGWWRGVRATECAHAEVPHQDETA